MATKPAKNVLRYRSNILDWYAHNKRDLPWRNTKDSYAIVLSEIMLQQTQVDRVIDHHRRWLQQFPDWNTLAIAQQKAVLTAWSGLGYNRRALNLHKCAKVVVEQHGGTLPGTVEELEALPGIGPYTARAVAAFAFDQKVATLDVNIARVQYRYIHGPERPQKAITTKEEWELARELYPARSPRYKEWNHALMDIGAMICTARDPQCQHCPLQKECSARATIHKALATHYKTRKRKQEPSREECGKTIPNRIFRGRIVEHLRNVDSAALEEIGDAIKKDFDTHDTEWLLMLLEQLAKDEMITLQNSDNSVIAELR